MQALVNAKFIIVDATSPQGYDAAAVAHGVNLQGTLLVTGIDSIIHWLGSTKVVQDWHGHHCGFMELVVFDVFECLWLILLQWFEAHHLALSMMAYAVTSATPSATVLLLNPAATSQQYGAPLLLEALGRSVDEGQFSWVHDGTALASCGSFSDLSFSGFSSTNSSTGIR